MVNKLFYIQIKRVDLSQTPSSLNIEWCGIYIMRNFLIINSIFKWILKPHKTYPPRQWDFLLLFRWIISGACGDCQKWTGNFCTGVVGHVKMIVRIRIQIIITLKVRFARWNSTSLSEIWTRIWVISWHIWTIRCVLKEYITRWGTWKEYAVMSVFLFCLVNHEWSDMSDEWASESWF